MMLTKKEILKTLHEKKETFFQYGIKEIGLFGSYSANTQHENSDIDILIDFIPEQETFDNLMAISDILENMFKNYKVEIVTRNGLSKYIGPHILKETEYV